MKFSDTMLTMIARGCQEAMEKYEREIAVLREGLAERLESDNYIKIEHTISGRLHTDELKPELEVSSDSYGGTQVKGNNFVTLVQEYLRRRGYDSRDATRYLPRPTAVLVTSNDPVNGSNDDDVVF